jgi:putative ABC transport system permease protein
MKTGISWLDVKLGVRMLWKYPGLSLAGAFAIAVVVAFGTAAAAFDAVINGSLPFEDGDRIVAIENWDAAANERQPRALHDLETWRRELKTIADVGAARLLVRNLSLPGRPAEPVRIAEISASAFRMARVPAMLGRYLIPDDELVAAPPVIVLGHDEWQRRFGADPSVVGRTVTVGETAHTVVGVMPDGFGFPVNEHYWVPFRLRAADYPRGQGPSLYVFGRLADGTSLEAAQAEVEVTGRRSAADSPDTHGTLRPRVQSYARWFFGGFERIGAVTVLAQAAVALLLVIIGANVAVLVYARTATRRNEIAIRGALGASRRRIVTQMFAEGLVLSAVAAAAGLIVAAVVRQQLTALIVQAPFWVDVTLTSAPVIRNAFALTLLGAVVTGVVPAMQATGRRAQTGMQHAAASASGWRVGRTYGALIVVQVALAVAILPVAVASVWQSMQAATADLGFPAEQFLMARLDLDRSAFPDADDGRTDPAFAARFRDRQEALVRRLRADPEIADISFLVTLPAQEPAAAIEIEGRDGRYQTGISRLPADFDQIGVDILEPLEIPLLAGRAFAARDLGATTHPVIVNRTFAERNIGGNAIGRRFRDVGNPAQPGPWLEIVGVIGDFPVPAIAALADPRMYFPAGRGEASNLIMTVRVRGRSPAAFSARFRALVTEVDRNLQLRQVTPLDEVLRFQEVELRLAATISGLMTFSVLLLSATGLYALMAFTVALRRREIGLRVALGASPLRLLATIMSRSLWQLTAGVGIGSVLAALLFSEGELTGGSGLAMLPPLVAFVLAIGLLAAATPARRALRIQPTEALRSE